VKPKISIVVASHNAYSNIARCLEAIEASASRREAEVIVVEGSNDRTQEIIDRQFPNVKLVHSGKGKLIPHLWEAGINCSQGDVVVLTTAHFIPAKNWIDQILLAHEGPYAGIGGAIENDPQGGLVSWAIYFCRYSPYILPFIAHDVNDFAADNGSYKREALDACRPARRNGFWEAFIHGDLRRTGARLLLSPDIVVYHGQSFTILEFICQRFRHGRQFGSERAQSISVRRRVALLLMSPLIPVVLLSRITRRVMIRKRLLGKYVLALPLLISFLLSWSLGELTGYAWRESRSLSLQ